MLSPDAGERPCESEGEVGLHPCTQAQPRSYCWRPSRAPDWAIALPSLLTACVLAYAGHQWLTDPTGAHTGAAVAPALKPAKAPPLVAQEPTQGLNPALRSTGIAQPKTLDEPVTRLEDVIALTDSIIESKAVLEVPVESFEPVSPQTAPRDLKETKGAREVQARLAELGYFSARPTGMWGSHSRRALRTFKDHNNLPPNDHWDHVTERVLFDSMSEPAPAFIGTWGSDKVVCSGRAAHSGIPTIIENSGARAGDASCSFNKKKQFGTAWNIAATCSNGGERWTANIQLAVEKDRLTWTSERGTQLYIRCGVTAAEGPEVSKGRRRAL